MQLSDLHQWISSQERIIEETLIQLVNKNTYTQDQLAVDEGMAMLSHIAEKMNFSIEVIQARHRLIKSGNGKKRPRILFVSHMDTVHPVESGFLHYEPLGDGFVRGPGVGDIKGGVVMGLWAMDALRQMNPDYDVQMVVSADEELASPTIKNWYVSGKSNADYIMGLEPGFPQGALSEDVPMGVVKQRKGTQLLHFKVIGKAAHAGGAPELGLSAIEAMAHRIPLIHALTDFERGITTNVGVVKGGTAQNTVAAECAAEVNMRFYTMKDANEVMEKVKAIINAKYVHNTKLDLWDQIEITYEDTMPPMEYTPQSQPMIDIVLEEAEKLNQKVVPIVRGGGSDANYLSANGTPSICGMGAPAEAIHTTDEKIHLPLMFRRLELLIRVTQRLLEEDPNRGNRS